MEGLKKKHLTRPGVHKVLAHSYTVYFVFFLLGIILDSFFNLKISDSHSMSSTGALLIFLGTMFILWAQTTSRHLNTENLTKNTFCHGPYRYTRCPTHWGLLLLILGLGMIFDAPFIMILSFVAFLVSKFTFLDLQEKMLEEKYGAPYREYKRMVKF